MMFPLTTYRHRPTAAFPPPRPTPPEVDTGSGFYLVVLDDEGRERLAEIPPHLRQGKE